MTLVMSKWLIYSLEDEMYLAVYFISNVQLESNSLVSREWNLYRYQFQIKNYNIFYIRNIIFSIRTFISFENFTVKRYISHKESFVVSVILLAKIVFFGFSKYGRHFLSHELKKCSVIGFICNCWICNCWIFKNILKNCWTRMFL